MSNEMIIALARAMELLSRPRDRLLAGERGCDKNGPTWVNRGALAR